MCLGLHRRLSRTFGLPSYSFLLLQVRLRNLHIDFPLFNISFDSKLIIGLLQRQVNKNLNIFQIIKTSSRKFK